jgi:hypothetical protein
MLIFAYKVPLPASWKECFAALDLSDTSQEIVQCPAGCGTKYALMYSNEIASETIDYYREQLVLRMGPCSDHPGLFKFTV